ncbi:hypothetical protein OIU83_22640, partial [Flavobacterium sp. LS1R49]
MKNLGVPYAIGYIIAGIIILPLLIFAVDKILFKGNNAEKYIYQYLDNSEELKIKIDLDAKTNYTIEDLKSTAEGKDFTFGHEIYTAFLSRKGGKIYIDKIGFYSEEYRKFFTIRLTNMGDNYYLRNVIKNKNVIITVNKDDMSNPLYGTKQNPIPIFKVVGDGKPITINSTDKNGLTT